MKSSIYKDLYARYYEKQVIKIIDNTTEASRYEWFGYDGLPGYSSDTYSNVCKHCGRVITQHYLNMTYCHFCNKPCCLDCGAFSIWKGERYINTAPLVTLFNEECKQLSEQNEYEFCRELQNRLSKIDFGDASCSRNCIDSYHLEKILTTYELIESFKHGKCQYWEIVKNGEYYLECPKCQSDDEDDDDEDEIEHEHSETKTKFTHASNDCDFSDDYYID